MTDEWQEIRARQSRAAAMAAMETRRRAELDRCLKGWRSYALRRRPENPREGREIIQDQVYAQILIETMGAGA